MTAPNNNAPIRLALADDQALVRAGLRALLEGFADLQVVVEVADGGELIAALEATPVDVILSDIRMPGVSGIEALQRLREAGKTTPVILLTTFDDADLMLEATRSGAQGFLLKDAAPEDLRDVILAASKGEQLLQPV
ncbi:MAG: response regulator transcription factor, partial [Dokdonella sp.]